MYKTKTIRFQKLVSPLLTLVLLIVLWQLSIIWLAPSKLIFPAPMDVLDAFTGNWVRLLKNLGITMLEAVLGFVLAAFVAFMISAVFIFSMAIRHSLYPLAIALKATPLITIAPLVIIWFGEGIESKIVMSATLAFFPILVATFDGMRRIPPELLDLMQSLSASPWQKFWIIRFPICLPSFFSSLKIAAPISVVGAVIGEYTGSTRGIGHLINIESYYLNTDVVFAAIICLAIASGIFFALVKTLENSIIFWENIGN